MLLGISVDVSDCTKMQPLIEKYTHLIKHIQIYLDNSPFDVNLHTISKMPHNNKSYSFHAYGNLNITDTNDYNHAIQTVDMLSSIGGTFVNFHVGCCNLNEQSRNMALERVIESTANLCMYAYKKGIEIHMENDIRSKIGCEKLGTTLYDWSHIFQIGQPNFHMCYDIGHANISFGDAFVFRQLMQKIGSFHIHNNDGINDLHIPFGNSGMIPLEDVLSELYQSNKYVILESEFDEYDNALHHLSNLYNAICIINLYNA